MRLHTSLLLGAGGAFFGFLPGADALVHASNQPRTTAWVALAEESRAPSAVPCPENQKSIELQPLDRGPARFAALRCLDLPRGQEYRWPPIVSPNGHSVAFWSSGGDSPLDVLTFDGSSGFRLFNRVTFRHFGSGTEDVRQQALAWRSDGSGLWSVEQQVARPSGWAISGLTPILIDRDANVQRFTPPNHMAGPLDGIAWVGAEGRAIAQFGTRGRLYRSEHEDPLPALAMIDVPSRRILDTLTADDAEALRVRAGASSRFGVSDVSAVQLRNGRMRALLQLRRPTSDLPRDQFLATTWLVWTQGKKPTQLSAPFDYRIARAELTPDGSHILAWRPLQPEGMISADCRNCRPPPPPTPIEATIATLIDTASGRTIWSVRARAIEFSNRSGGPVISPTGRFALIPLPAVDRRQIIALLSMADGRVLQRFSLACSGCYPQSFGFTRGGDQTWIGVMNRLAFYELENAKLD